MLRKLRKEKGFTRMFIAEKLKINAKYLNEIERGQGAMPMTRAKLLGELYDTDYEKILNMWRKKNDEGVIEKRNETKKKIVRATSKRK